MSDIFPDASDPLADSHPRVHRVELASGISAGSVVGASSIAAGSASFVSSAAAADGDKDSAASRASEQQATGPFAAFFLALRHRLARVLDLRVLHLEEKLRALDNTRHQSNFDVGRFVLLKEGVALAYQQVQLREEALRHYDELEVVLDSVVGRLGSVDLPPHIASGSDNAPRPPASFGLPNILSSPCREFRDRILKAVVEVVPSNAPGQRTPFSTSALMPADYHHHVFARQCRLVLALGRPLDALKRGLAFLKSFGALLLPADCAANEYFRARTIHVRCWTVRSYLELAAVTQRAIEAGSISGSSNSSNMKIQSQSLPFSASATAALSLNAASKLTDGRWLEFRGLQGELFSSALRQLVLLGQLVDVSASGKFDFYTEPANGLFADSAWFENEALSSLAQKLSPPAAGIDATWTDPTRVPRFGSDAWWHFVIAWLGNPPLRLGADAQSHIRPDVIASPALSRQFREFVSSCVQHLFPCCSRVDDRLLTFTSHSTA